MGIDNLKKQDNKKNVIVSVLKVLLLVAIVVGIPLYIYFFQKDWLSPFPGVTAARQAGYAVRLCFWSARTPH